MKNYVRGIWMITVTALLTLAGGNVMAKGGFIELEGIFDGNPANASYSINLTNPWWPLPEGLRQIHLAEIEDECVISVLDVMAWVPPYDKTIDGVDVRTVMDREFIDDVGDCDGDVTDLGEWELLEITLDWYGQDIDKVIWYFGEHTISLDEEDCEHETDGVDPILGEEGCLDGSWEAGYDLWEEVADPEILEGIIMLRYPEKGMFYFQEFWEDNADDMGKVLNFKDVETFLFGEQEACLVTKEWVPLEPGNVEHKYYCFGKGLVLVEGNAGGKTEWTDLVYDSRYPGLP